jgi:hypothetical protein
VGAQGKRLIVTSKIALVSKEIGKSSLGFDGYQYRIHWKNWKLISWVFIKDKCDKGKGKLKTDSMNSLIKWTIVAFQN